jgi:hypothetical protein
MAAGGGSVPSIFGKRAPSMRTRPVNRLRCSLRIPGTPIAAPGQDDGARYPGRIPPILDGPEAEDCALASMRAHNAPITRSNHIFMAYGTTVWGAELESELPEELQNWDQTEWPCGHEGPDEDGEEDE